MRVFVLHEFQNATGNTDVYDTISSHRGRVFTPLYLSKPRKDANGMEFVVLIQVAPYNVASRHAANHGNLGPGLEVAKNRDELLSPLQAKAGILAAEFMKQAVPRIRVVHHRGSEGLAMQRAYTNYLRYRKNHRVQLPFTRARQSEVSLARTGLRDLLGHQPEQGPSKTTPPVPVLVSTGEHKRSAAVLDREDPEFIHANASTVGPQPIAETPSLLSHLAALARNIR
jgi:hypothetical protein